MQKLIAEIAQGEETVGSLSLSNLQEVKECLEREQGCIERVQQDLSKVQLLHAINGTVSATMSFA